ncbi:hypothetical protein C2S53_004031 [Perilla frutescens var. hirtella]|uniref:BHLH domain-containing protein n=1 Tax=Perilla frutescens var. hirtella TaxID=608512 RepID=A0AAD4JJF7_PERFH|nr:hypothetical protein C2S53_004031 [Perilla frutescens var. hirtella]
MSSSADDCNEMVDCMLNIPPSPPPSPNLCCSNSFNNADLADAVQLAEFGPELASNEAKSCEEEIGIDCIHEAITEENMSVQLNYSAVEDLGNSPVVEGKNKRKRARATKTNEEVERQRMTHIAVERNRRKQMNEHLQLLRSLMPTCYIHRGDQASIVGGAIEFVRELEQLLQCLESLKRQQQPLIFLGDQAVEDEAGLFHDETSAESKSCLADVEVKLSGLFGLIKILSKRRPGQLIKTIAAVEHLHLHILQTDVTTIDQTVVCSFTVKMSGEARFTAEDIANSIQQILSSVHANTSMS